MTFATDTMPVDILDDGTYRACSFDDCNRRALAHNLCETHRKQLRRGADLVPITSNKPPAGVDIPVGYCWCKQCQSVLPLSSYSAHYTKPGRRVSICKACLHADRPRRSKKARPVDVVVSAGEKWCPSCELVKPMEGFHQRSNYCKPCHLDSNRRTLYGLAAGEYERMYSEQDGKCAICNEKCRRGGDVLCVDHDHVTGMVRGLLCSECNRALGGFRDNPERLRRAVSYLEGRP